MDEDTLEKKVGDIYTRKRLAKDVLDGKEVAYGPITLRPVEEGVLPVDFDGRVYATIHTGEFSNTEDKVNHIVTEADNRIEKLYEEL